MEEKIISVDGRVISLGNGSIALPINGTILCVHELLLAYENELNADDYEEYKVKIVTGNSVAIEDYTQLWNFLKQGNYLVSPTINEDILTEPVILSINAKGDESHNWIQITGFADNTDSDAGGGIIFWGQITTVISDTVTVF